MMSLVTLTEYMFNKLKKFKYWLIGLLIPVAFAAELVTAPPIDEGITAATAIKEQIEGKTEDEQHTIVADEFQKSWDLPKQRMTAQHADYEIEVTKIEKTSDGIAVFAKAWTPDGKQLGFGKDGTVEIERFLFHDPSYLVQDGTSFEVTDPLNGYSHFEKNYKEDPKQFIMDILSLTIADKQEKFIDSNIKIGKIGNTTSIFWPDEQGAPSQSSVDGRIFAVVANQTWTDKRNEAGTGASPSATSNICIFIDEDTTEDKWDAMYRCVFLFDTAPLPDSEDVSAVSFSARLNAAPIDTYTSAPREYTFVTSNPASDITLVGSDYAIAKWGTTELTDTRVDISALSNQGWATTTMNSAGISNVSKTATSSFSIRMDLDFDDASDSWEGNKEAGVNFYQADSGGSSTANSPRLTVEHAEGEPPAVGEEYTSFFGF